MKKHITLIIVLMATAVSAVIGLQLYWNYQNYKNTVKNFDHDINEALRVAVDREIDQRHQVIIKQFAKWMNDTSLVKITCHIKNRDRQTQFNVRDTHPYDKGDKGISLSINDFKQQLPEITPQVKQYFINYFCNNTVMRDLKKGIVYFYTQRLGDSLKHEYFISKMNMPVLKEFYKQELHAQNINSAFNLDRKNTKPAAFLTQKVNTSLRRPYENDTVMAGFESPNRYFLSEMKWLIFTTLMLIGITVFCFAYTTKTLLSQHKLSEQKNIFINNMTHELNTPLSSIKVTVEALNKFRHTPERLDEYLSIISYQTDKLTDLTAQILNTNSLIRLREDNWTPINISNLIEEAVRALTPQFSNRNAELIFEPDQFGSIVNGDFRNLLNVFTNIMDNALKYNTSPTPSLNIFSRKINEKYVEISFADNGPGIVPEYRSKIFDQFFRVPQGDRHDVKGYGLGLSYVKKIVESYKGSIFMLSNSPQGSIFIIKLPLC